MRILLLGSTGSIGNNTCACISRHPGRFTLTGISANNNTDLLKEHIHRFAPESVCLCNKEIHEPFSDYNGRVFRGPDGLVEMVEDTEFDVMVNAIVGSAGLPPTIAALKKGKRVALANKESLVIAGDLIKQILGEDNRDRLIPVDSEHSAILQCLQGESRSSMESIIITASGGPFRERPWKSFKNITPSDALNHPTWEMGKKISIDSATLMNKGFEVIEAHHLFDLSYDRIRVVIHPESIIHSMIEFFDGAVMAQCGLPDMELPIQYALSYPERLPIKGKRFKPAEWSSLHFESPDKERFPCLSLCIEAGKMGMTYPAVLNAANEVAVSSFLAEEIGFTDIPAVIEHTINTHSPCRPESLEVLIDTDTETRAKAKEFIRGKL